MKSRNDFFADVQLNASHSSHTGYCETSVFTPTSQWTAVRPLGRHMKFHFMPTSHNLVVRTPGIALFRKKRPKHPGERVPLWIESSRTFSGKKCTKNVHAEKVGTNLSVGEFFPVSRFSSSGLCPMGFIPRYECRCKRPFPYIFNTYHVNRNHEKKIIHASCFENAF